MTVVAMDSEHFDDMEKVAELTMKGYSATAISKEMNISRKNVLSLQEDFKMVLSQDNAARDMAHEHLNMMGKHFDKLIRKYYELLDDIKTLDFTHQVAGQRNSALKSIAELEEKRLNAYQKAGLLEGAELGDELAEAEEKRAILIDILRNDLCSSCRTKVAHKLGQVTGTVEEVKVYDVEVVDDDE
jgi:hypothetical protein